MEGRLEAVMQHDGKTNAHNAAEPPNAAPARLLAGRRASSRACEPLHPRLFTYNRRGWIPRTSSYFRILLFPLKSCCLLALWLFQRKTLIRSLFRVETSWIFPLPLARPYLPFSPKPPFLFQLLPCYCSCCHWLCLSFLLTRSPGHSCSLLQCQSQRKLGERVVNPYVESEQINSTSRGKVLEVFASEVTVISQGFT